MAFPFCFGVARNDGVDLDGSYGLATEFTEEATETARSAPSGVPISSNYEPGRIFFVGTAAFQEIEPS